MKEVFNKLTGRVRTLTYGEEMTTWDNPGGFKMKAESVATRALGARRKTMYLCCDQLCIDQGSTQEQNHQVAMMGRIYSTACETLAWLGDRRVKLTTVSFEDHANEEQIATAMTK